MSDSRAGLLQTARAELARATGRRYPIDLDALDDESLRAFVRLLRDMRLDRDRDVRRARMTPCKG